MIEMRRILLFLSLLPLFAQAQFNTDRLVMIGRSALYYEDYVLSIQYFNQAISQKPWLYEPWFFRGVAKFYLDDFRGAEIDCSEAIERNPYVVSAYELRGLSRINQKKFAEAVSDYDRALRYDPENQGLWHNRILCLIQEKDYLILTMVASGPNGLSSVWPVKSGKKVRSFLPRVSIFFQNIQTIISTELWLVTIRTTFVGRCPTMIRPSTLTLITSLVTTIVAFSNRGIEDFNFVLKLEPDNLMALFNRALLLEQTGNLRGAVRDYSKVIEEYPNFWFGLQHRASCYRRLGNTKQAELDEFRILKAQMDKRYGKQPRLSKKQMRKRSDEDLEKYNQLVVADEQEVEHEYKSDYRGRVQNRKAELVWQPMYGLTFIKPQNDVKIEIPYESTVDQFNQRSGSHTVFVSCEQRNLSEERMKQTFSYIDSLSTRIDEAKTTTAVVPLLLLRAVAYGTIQNFDNAIDDLSICLQIDSTSSLAYWQRAVCQAKINEFNASQGTNIELKSANVMGDLSEAIQQSPKNAYLYYNRGNLYAQRNDYQHAIDDYTRALKLEERLAEAWFNRGLAKIYVKRVNEGIEDLSKAGELGLYQAYSVIKKYREK